MNSSHLAPVNFLLVDDLDENLLALEALLKRDGLVLLKARSGAEALELLLKHDVALALVDVQMPGMDGFELAELLRGTERTRRIPIIFLTAGSGDRQRRFRGYETGGVDFLTKPIESHILRNKAEVFFELYRQRQEVAFQRDELELATAQNVRLLAESRHGADELKLADQRKDEFLAMLAHELRNPLAPISSAVEILRIAEHNPTVADEAREIIARQVHHMARLVDDLLDVARIARGKVQIRKQRCDLVPIVRQTTEDYAPTVTAAGLTLQLELQPDELLIEGDPTRLTQVIGNLLHNACKFTSSGGKITVRAAADLQHDNALVTVIDNGAGIEPSVRQRLFEPFSQADQAIDRDKGGLGLGLALAKGLIELHGGSVCAESPGVGQGSTFTLTIPLSGRRHAPAGATTNTRNALNESLKILLVEDNVDTATAMQSLLALMGHDVRVEFEGRSAVSTALEFQPEVIVSDLGLPGELDGFGLARTVRADTQLKAAYLIALSGYGRDEDRQNTAAAGFNEHLVKPVDLKTLMAALNNVPRSGATEQAG